MPAGLLFQAEAATLESHAGVQLPALEAPPGVPILAPLPAPTATWLCPPGDTGRQLVCADGWQACKDCTRVGVDWVCPKGFAMADGGKAQELPPCLPAPADCGDSTYPAWSAGPAPIHVRTDALAGGDGSQSSPLRTLAEALKLAKAGDRIALASGKYIGGVQVALPVHIRGRCAAKVSIQGFVDAAAIQVVGPRVPDPARPGQSMRAQVSDVTLIGGRPGFEVTGPLPAMLQRVHVRGARQAGVMVKGEQADIEVRRVVVADLIADVNGAGFGIALATIAARAAIVDSRVSGARVAGVIAAQKGQLVVDGLLVDRTTELVTSGLYGSGLVVQGGSKGKVAHARLWGNTASGMLVAGKGSEAEVTGLLVEGTLPRQSALDGGHGVQLSEGARLTLLRSRLTANRSGALLVTDPGSALEASALLADGTLPRSADGALGVGVQVNKGAKATLRSARLSGNLGAGLDVDGAGTMVDARWLLVDATGPQASDGQAGYGMQADRGASVVLDRARLSDNRIAGLTVLNTGSRVLARELLIDGTREDVASGLWGNGVVVEKDALAELRHSRVTDNMEVGVAATQGGRVRMVGALVDSTRDDPLPQGDGSGVQAHHGAALSMVGSRIAANRLIGVVAGSDGTTATLHGTVIEGTLGSGQKPAYGVGFYSLAGAKSVQIVSSLLRANATAGIAVHDAGAALLGSAVLDTRQGPFALPAGPGLPAGRMIKLADGIAAVQATDLQVEESIVWQQERAGLLLLQCTNVALRHTIAGAGFYGLVVQGSPPAEQSALLLHANTTNLASDQGLVAPKAPVLVELSTGD